MGSGNSVSSWSVRTRQILNKLGMLSFDSLSRIRCRIELLDSCTTVSTVTTCSTVTSMTQIGAVNATPYIYDQSNMCWDQCVGRLIS